MAAGATYSPIDTATSTGGSSTIIFNSIPQTYTDLVLVIDGLGPTGNPYFDTQFNTDTSSGSQNYSFTRLIGFGTGAAYSDRYQNFFSLEPSIGDTDIGNIIMNIQNYRNTNMFKTVLWRDGNKGASLNVGLWRDTSAINKITLTGGNNNTIPSGTNFTLYGIEAA